MPNPHDIKPGQTLWFVPQRGNPREVAVETIGRKWIMLANGWFVDSKTLIVGGGRYPSPGRCYLSRDAYETERYRVAAWDKFRDAIHDQHTPPPGFGPSNLGAVWKALGWDHE